MSRLALKSVVVIDRADQRADQHELVHQAGRAREQLGNLDSGHVRRDWLHHATNLARRVELQIEHVLMRRPARQEDVDDRLVRTPDARLRLRLQQLSQARAAEAQGTDA